MTCDYTQLANNGVQQLRPYQPGKPVEELQRELGSLRERLWEAMVKVWPDYDNYQKKTDRQIPVVLLLLSSAQPKRVV